MTLSVSTLPLDQLHEDPENARKHGLRNLSAIAGSLREFGQQAVTVGVGSSFSVTGIATVSVGRASDDPRT